MFVWWNFKIGGNNSIFSGAFLLLSSSFLGVSRHPATLPFEQLPTTLTSFGNSLVIFGT